MIKEPDTSIDLSFLKSNRFWALVLGDVAVILQDPTIAETRWFVTLGKFVAILAAGFITIRTIDRGTEKLGK